MKLRLIFLTSLLALLYSLVAEGSGKKPKEIQKGVKVFVSIPPQSYFVERIGGEHVSVRVLVESGKDPHTFEITPKQAIDLAGADLFFGIGFPFEKQILRKVQRANPHFLLIETDTGVKRRTLDEVSVHHNQGNDPHIWLSPSAIKIIVTNIYEGLAKTDQANDQAYNKNLNEFLAELTALDARLKQLLKHYRGKPFFVFHPAFGYFADEYGLVQIPVEIEGKSPTPKRIETLTQRARMENVRIIFVSPQFDRKGAETIAEAIGGAVVSINPLEKNVLNNLEEIAEKVENSFE